MQNDSAITKMELGCQERNDIALNGKEIHEEPSHRVTIPSDRAALYP
jgi:hypothetical protein